MLSVWQIRHKSSLTKGIMWWKHWERAFKICPPRTKGQGQGIVGVVFGVEDRWSGVNRSWDCFRDRPGWAVGRWQAERKVVCGCCVLLVVNVGVDAILVGAWEATCIILWGLLKNYHTITKNNIKPVWTWSFVSLGLAICPSLVCDLFTWAFFGQSFSTRWQASCPGFTLFS